MSLEKRKGRFRMKLGRGTSGLDTNVNKVLGDLRLNFNFLRGCEQGAERVATRRSTLRVKRVQTKAT